jgi:hypothetical protein
MRRSVLTLVAVSVLAAWAGAQVPRNTLDAATQAKLFKSNKTLLEDLVTHGIDLADADRPLQRAEECRKTATTLVRHLDRAAEDQDPDRVVELAGLMGDVIRDGLVPNLDDAQKEIRPGDPRFAQLTKVFENATRDLDGLSQLPTEGKVGESRKVKEAIAALQALKGNLQALKGNLKKP